MKILCIVTENGLVPKYDSDREEFRSLKRNTDVLVEVGQKRNYEFHKKVFLPFLSLRMTIFLNGWKILLTYIQ